MKISIFGMGYVGSVTAACLLKEGHSIVAVEIVEDKVDKLRRGEWPIFEKGLDDLVPREIIVKDLKVETDAMEAVLKTEISIICVGTPNLPDGNVDITYVSKTVEEINRALVRKKADHMILIRSTVPPGTTESILSPILHRDIGKDKGLTVGFYPEFLREGSAIKDFFEPSLNVLGCDRDFPIEVVNKLLPDGIKDVRMTSIKTAESIKYANNSFHALKIAFANELASICSQYGVNMEETMDIFCQDTTLNISPYYLRPGFAFGGSCLPKEIRGIISMAKDKKVESALFEGILKSNDNMVERFVSFVYRMNPSSIGYFGITFKPETDDIRESPVLRAIEVLLSKSTSYSKVIDQIVFDNDKAISKVRGKFGDGFRIADTPEELLLSSDVIVLGPHRIDRAVESKIISCGKPVIDLKWHRVGENLSRYPNYHSFH